MAREIVRTCKPATGFASLKLKLFRGAMSFQPIRTSLFEHRHRHTLQAASEGIRLKTCAAREAIRTMDKFMAVDAKKQAR